MVRRINLKAYYGRRPVILFLFGLIWILVGYGMTTDGDEDFSRPGPGGPLQFMDDQPWPGFAWVTGGVIAIVCSLLRSRGERWDGYGFNGLAIPPFFWGIMYFWSWASYVLYGGMLGQPNLRRSVVFFSITVFVLFIASWPDPDDPHRKTHSSTPENEVTG